MGFTLIICSGPICSEPAGRARRRACRRRRRQTSVCARKRLGDAQQPLRAAGGMLRLRAGPGTGASEPRVGGSMPDSACQCANGASRPWPGHLWALEAQSHRDTGNRNEAFRFIVTPGTGMKRLGSQGAGLQLAWRPGAGSFFRPAFNWAVLQAGLSA